MALNRLTSAQITLLNAQNPQLLSPSHGNYAFGTELDSLIANINFASLGITAIPEDVDAVAKDGNCFSEGTHSGLTFNVNSGEVMWGDTKVAYAAQGVTLSASLTNYIEALPNGTIVKNTTGFTTGYYPLFAVLTGSSTITTVTKKRVMSSMLGTTPNNPVLGRNLSAAAKAKRHIVAKGTLSATGSVMIPAPGCAATISGIWMLASAGVTASDTNYWTFTGANKGADGTGTNAILDTGATNKTTATGGSGLSANVMRSLTLTGTTAYLNVVANSVLLLTATATGSPTSLSDLEVIVEFTFEV
jgi:hypothetical protein